jgi:hypothetical protein
MTSVIRRASWCVLALAAIVVCTGKVLFWAVCTAPGIAWNDARLAPSFALARGLPIYALPDSAQQLGWMYGPVFPLWFLPVAFTDNITRALALAGIWNATTLLLSVALVLAAARVPWLGVLFGVALSATLFVATDGIDWIFHIIHVDTVCLAFGWTACAALHRAAAEHTVSSHRWIVAAAFSLVLACWSKQLALGLAPAAVIWLWREGRRDLVGPFVWWFFAGGTALTVIFFILFGPAELLFNTVVFPAANPYRADAFASLPALLRDVAIGLWPCAALGAWARWTLPGTAPERLPAPASAMMRLLFLAALCQIPLGVAAALKQGGNSNSLHSEYYLVVGLVVALSHAWAQLCAKPGGLRSIRGLVLFLLVVFISHNAWTRAQAHGASETLHQGEERMLAIARTHPGKVYLPWNPSIMIVTERRVFPFDDALHSLSRAGWEPSAANVRAFMPKGTLVVYPEPCQSTFALRYLTPPDPAPPSSPAASLQAGVQKKE